MNKKSYTRYKSYYSNIAGPSKSPYYWHTLLNDFDKEEDHVIKGLIPGWKCVLSKSSNVIRISCTSKKLEYGMRVVVTASMKKNSFYYWDNSYVKVTLSDNTLDTINDLEKENSNEVDIHINIQNDSNNFNKGMNVMFFNEFGVGATFSMKNNPKLFEIIMNINKYVDKVKSRLILEQVSYGK